MILFQFNPSSPLNIKDSEFINDPRLGDRIHCVAFVLDASADIQPEMMYKLKAFRRLGNQKGKKGDLFDVPTLYLIYPN